MDPVGLGRLNLQGLGQGETETLAFSSGLEELLQGQVLKRVQIVRGNVVKPGLAGVIAERRVKAGQVGKSSVFAALGLVSGVQCRVIVGAAIMFDAKASAVVLPVASWVTAFPARFPGRAVERAALQAGIVHAAETFSVVFPGAVGARAKSGWLVASGAAGAGGRG